jgi:hypothetical protein
MIMKKKLIANFEGDSYNHSNWMYEKTRNVLESICHLIDTTKDMEGETWDYLIPALNDCLKLYAFWSGDRDIYSPDVMSFLTGRGYKGFRHLAYVSGNSPLKDELTQKLEDNNTIKEIFALITPDNNRTKIYDELTKIENKNKWCRIIEDDLERVTMGEKNWKWFYDRHKNDNMKDIVVDFQTLIKNNAKEVTQCPNPTYPLQ